MNKLIELTKVSFLSNLTSGKEGKGGRFLMTIILTAVLGIISVIYNIVICETMLFIGTELGNYNTLTIMNDYITVVFVFASLFSLFMAMFQMQNAIFHTKDFELLESYPVDTKLVVASKILGIYLMTLFEDFIICIPAIVLYAIHTLNVYGIIVSVICMLFVSLISILVASLVSIVLGYVDSKLKTGSILSLVLYVILFTMLFFFMRNLTSNFQSSEEIDYNGLVSIINMSPQLV